MRTRIQRRQPGPWHLALIAVAVFGAALGWLYWRQQSGLQSDARSLLAPLPRDRATIVYIDAARLRRTGILDLIAGSKAAEEADYRTFVEQTGFDYRTDLDAVGASFNPSGSYFVLLGRFQWPRLNAYANAQGGECRNGVCNVRDGASGRNISFYPLSSGVLALAVNPGPWGVMSIAAGRARISATLPPEPVWISAPAAVTAQMDQLPLAAGLLLAPLARAETVTLALGARGADFQMRLEAQCSSPEIAATVTRQLAGALAALRQAVSGNDLGKQAGKNPAGERAGLSAVLAKGAWEQREARVIGTWLLQRSFVVEFAGGQIE